MEYYKDEYMKGAGAGKNNYKKKKNGGERSG